MAGTDPETQQCGKLPDEVLASDKPTYSLGQMVKYALYLGTFGFGGPIALVGYMHRDLVEQRKWISEADYKEGLTLSQIMPGPLAAQLAIYLGYVHYSLLGATLVGTAFVLPSFLMVVGLGWAYLAYGGLPWMQAVFYGVSGCVIGIIFLSAVKLTQKTIAKSMLLWGIYVGSAVTTIVTESESVWLFLGAGVLVWVVRTPPRGLGRNSDSTASAFLPIGVALEGTPVADNRSLEQILLFFAKAGAFVFGSGLAIVPFLYSGVVKEYGWLNDQEFLDAVAVAMVTPGPVVITVGFIGYLVDGLAGAVVAAIGTFLPCYILTVIPAPYFKKHGKRPGLVAFVDGVTAAAVGALAGAVVVLGQRTILDGCTPDLFKVVVLLATVAILFKFKRLPEPILVLCAALAGLIAYPLIH
ncbi:MAG: chromate transporter [Planctomycetes bacterium]|nr:chromate transporter [Planctomycetota bacterium]